MMTFTGIRLECPISAKNPSKSNLEKANKESHSKGTNCKKQIFLLNHQSTNKTSKTSPQGPHNPSGAKDP